MNIDIATPGLDLDRELVVNVVLPLRATAPLSGLT
jgi:hypothetical protein